LLLCVALAAVAHAQTDTQKSFEELTSGAYRQELILPGKAPNQLLNATKAWLYVNARLAENSGLIDDMENDLFVGRYVLKLEGQKDLLERLSKNRVEFTLQLNAYAGKCELRLDKFTEIDALNSKTLKDQYLLSYESWKKENAVTLSLASEERKQAGYLKYQQESQKALEQIDAAVQLMIQKLTEYLKHNA
ncbi:MAG: hypothetical protein ACK5XP_10120, partial [Sphingobacteriia bacterium]